ncbi:MAG TPA: cation diffusion facilitator family transporter [Mucilaginibacter sp.]|nr:cation diffusion facilitator family transporter [Mucilaginibacter sp.]
MQQQKRIILLALVTGIILMIAKFGAYLLTASNFVLTDAAESIVNVLASSFAFFSIYLASQPRDENHPYGHGKVEYFSVFIEGTLIGIAAVVIIFKSVYAIFYPTRIHDLLTGAMIIGATGIVNGALGYYMVTKGKSLRSITVEADGRHLTADMFTSVGLVVGLLLIHFTKIEWLDSALSILVAMYILYSSYKLVRKSVSGLMDEADFGVVNEVVMVLNERRRESWIDIHNFRAQKYGNDLHIDCHLTLPNYFDLNQVHTEVKLVDELINREVTKTELFIHTDPCLPDCCYYCNMPNCPIRSEPKREDITWTMEKVIRNKKHFE